MKYLFKYPSTYFLLVGILFFSPFCLHAQKIIHGDTSYTKWQRSVVRLKSIYKRENPQTGSDTLLGSAFLVSDHNKLYLVTAKHLIQSTLNGKNEQLANNFVFIRAGLNINNWQEIKSTYLNIGGLYNKDVNKSPVVFSSDEEDIAIISLQKKETRDIAVYLLKQGNRATGQYPLTCLIPPITTL